MLKLYHTLLQRIHPKLKSNISRSNSGNFGNYLTWKRGLSIRHGYVTYGKCSYTKYYLQWVLHHHKCHREGHDDNNVLFFWFPRHIPNFRYNLPKQSNEKDLEDYFPKIHQGLLIILTSYFIANRSFKYISVSGPWTDSTNTCSCSCCGSFTATCTAACEFCPFGPN